MSHGRMTGQGIYYYKSGATYQGELQQVRVYVFFFPLPVTLTCVSSRAARTARVSSSRTVTGTPRSVFLSISFPPFRLH
jgi:hypothetical protein